MKRVAVIADSLEWVQAQRVKDLQPYLPDFTLVVMTPEMIGGPTGGIGSFYTMSFVGYDYAAVWLSSWRILLAHPWLSYWLRPNHTLASVTSHYNLGGGLKPDTCFRKGADPKEEFQRAIETLRYFKVVTCNSKILHDMLQPHLPNVILAQNGVDAEFFRSSERILFGDGRLAFTTIGKQKEAKNAIALATAATELEARHDWFRWNAFLKKKWLNSKFTRHEVRSLLLLSDFYVCASWSEGTPNGLLEAAACGLPVITTMVGNAPELIREGETGWFIEPTAESLIACIERLQYLQPWEYRRMSEQIREDIEAGWTWEKRAPAFRRALEAACA